MEKMKDSDLLARLIYRAYIAPDPHAPLEAEALLPFAAALRFYARTVCAEEAAELMEEKRQQMLEHTARDAAGTLCTDSCPVTILPDPPKKCRTATQRRGAVDGEGAARPFAGHAAGEKREIYADVVAYVATHGLGARRRIAEASGGELTLYDVQAMADAGRVQLSKWRAARTALERLAEEEKQSASK